MKYFMPCVMTLPFLTSCIAQGGYSERYFAPPPPPHVHRHHNPHPVPRVRVEQHGHYHNNHGHAPTGARAVVVNPRQPKAHVEGAKRGVEVKNPRTRHEHEN